MPPSHREEAETHEARAACPGHTASERGAVTLTGVRLHGHAVLVSHRDTVRLSWETRWRTQN